MIRVSSRSQYALRALSYLAKKDRLVSIADIAEHEHIPFEFLEKIIQTLKRGGVLLSERGARGGYALAQDPEHISVKSIFEALNELRPPAKCLNEESGACDLQQNCSSQYVWKRMHQAMLKEIEQISLADLLTEDAHLQSSNKKIISCSA